MTFKLSYEDRKFNESLKQAIKEFPFVKFESYDVILFTERKKAFKLKGGYSARLDPFGVLLDDDNKPVKAFYSEAGECTIDNIISTLKTFIPYEER